MDILARHRAQHERPEAKQRLPMTKPVAPEPGPSPKQRRTVLPLRTLLENPVGPDVLPEDPETRALHRQHWQSIRTEEATDNPIQERHNWTLLGQPMLFPMPGRTPWNSSEKRRSSNQNVLPPVPAVQTDGFQGLPWCVLRRPDGVRAVVQLERVCLRPARDGRGRLNNSCVIFFF